MEMIRKLFAMRPKPELKELYIFSVLFAMASALISIFEPVFFYKEGFSLSTIALYYALHYTLYLFLLPVGAKFVARFGLERSLSWSMPIFVLYFLMLAALPHFTDLFWIAWIVLAFFKVLYWPAYHTTLTKFGESGNRGTELSWIFAINNGVGVLGPLVGGIIIVTLGFPVLFIIAASLSLLAMFPLLRTKERYRVTKFEYDDPWRELFGRRNRRMLWASFGWVENLVDLVFWPIFMFIVLGSADKLGYIASFNVLLMVLFGFVIGEYSDRVPRRQVLRMHVPFLLLSYLFRPLAGSPFRILLTESLGKTSYIGVRLPMMHKYFTAASRTSPLRYMVAVEMSVALAKMIGSWAFVYLLAVTLPYTGLTAVFIIAAMMTLFYLFL